MNHKQIVMITFFIFIALAERLWFDLGSNIELITLATFLTALYFNKKAALFVGVFILAFSDIFKGNTSIAVFTWSAYALIGIGFGILTRYKKPGMRIIASFGGAFGAAVFFYLWTNFGVWLLDSFGMYSNEFSGLVASYIVGIPFFKAQLFSNLIILPVAVGVIEFFHIYSKNVVVQPASSADRLAGQTQQAASTT